MSYRESSITRRPSRRRRVPIWRLLIIILIGIVVLFAIGFGVSMIFRSSETPQADPAQSSMSEPLPCETTMVNPAEVLPISSKVKVSVHNSTNKIGLAGDTAKVLKARGFIIKEVGNDPMSKNVQGVAEIRYGPKGAARAQLLAFHFPGAILVQDNRSGKIVDVALGAAFTELEGEAQIAAAMASPSPSTSGPGCSSAAPVSPEPASEPGAEVSPSPSAT
ncbi:MAG: LytR C-terminal domain-containing protein [Actinomycetota bacterium]|nr:LytR C-terminal domain-containing protein [Actinomycetota bacterium]